MSLPVSVQVGNFSTISDASGSNPLTVGLVRMGPLSGIVLVISYSTAAGSVINAVTYGGTNCTFLAAAGNAVFDTEIWYLEGPSVTGTASITWDVAPTYSAMTVVEFTGCKQSGMIGISNSAAGTTSPITVTLVGTTANSMCIDGAWASREAGDTTLTAVQGTSLQNVKIGTAGTADALVAASHYITSGAGGNITLSWTESTNRQWKCNAAEILAAATILRDVIEEQTQIPVAR